MKIESIEQLQKVAEEYEVKNSSKNKLKKALTPIGKAIKDFMLEKYGEKSTYAFENGLTIDLGQQNRSKVNDNRLVKLLKEKGLTKAIKTVEVPDEMEVERLVYDGKISQEEYSTCIDAKFVNTLKVKIKGVK